MGSVKRAVGVRIKAKCKKNKVSMPFRECEMTITFGFGINDVEASLEWLAEVKALDRLGLKEPDALAYRANEFLEGSLKAHLVGRHLRGLCSRCQYTPDLVSFAVRPSHDDVVTIRFRHVPTAPRFRYLGNRHDRRVPCEGARRDRRREARRRL